MGFGSIMTLSQYQLFLDKIKVNSNNPYMGSDYFEMSGLIGGYVSRILGMFQQLEKRTWIYHGANSRRRKKDFSFRKKGVQLRSEERRVGKEC